MEFDVLIPVRCWVDFSFRIGGVARYFVETKRANEDLNDPRWVIQAIDYAWTKSVTWALLSDFEGLKVLNAEWKEANPFHAQFIEFSIDNCFRNSTTFRKVNVISKLRQWMLATMRWLARKSFLQIM